MMTAVVAAERSLKGRRLRYDGAEWSLGEKLGSGRFATVYLAKRSSVLSLAGAGAKASRYLAVKVTDTTSISSWAQTALVREASIWSGLNHPHIVKMVGHISTPTQHVLLLEHAAGGELFDRIISMQNLSEASAARMISQLLSAVTYLHANGVAHRDLKPENIVLASSDEDAPIKVADFGAAALLTPGQGLHTPCGSMGYAAPEQLSGLDVGVRYPHLGDPKDQKTGLPLRPEPQRSEAYYFEVDIWAVGVVSYILLSGVMPFDPTRYREQPLTVTFPEHIFAEVSPEAKDFVSSLLRLEPTQRLKADEALDHPWIISHVGRLRPSPSPVPLATAYPSTGSTAAMAGLTPLYSLAPPASPRPPNAPAVVTEGLVPGDAPPAVAPSPNDTGKGTYGLNLRIDVGSMGMPGCSTYPSGGNYTPSWASPVIQMVGAITPRLAASLSTPTHLRVLKASGALKEQWSFNKDPAGSTGSLSSMGERTRLASPLRPTKRNRDGLIDATRATAMPAGGESAVAAGIIAASREYVPLGGTDVSNEVIIELPQVVRRRLHTGGAQEVAVTESEAKVSMPA